MIIMESFHLDKLEYGALTAIILVVTWPRQRNGISAQTDLLSLHLLQSFHSELVHSDSVQSQFVILVLW